MYIHIYIYFKTWSAIKNTYKSTAQISLQEQPLLVKSLSPAFTYFMHKHRQCTLMLCYPQKPKVLLSLC